MISTIAVPEGTAPRLVATSRVGCSPVRIVLSADGSIAFVSLRGEDRVAAFHTEELRVGHASPVALADVGAAPVGLSLSADGRSLWVANSNRFAEGQLGSLSCLTVGPNGSLTRIRDVSTGQFPRELTRMRDGRLAVTLFRDDAIQVITTSLGCS